MGIKSNIRIIDIAKLANVSVGTVDRVIHNRGRVSLEKREKVEKVLKEMNYEPNMVARFLASKRTFTFAVIVPAYSEGEYWELVCSGINKSVYELRDFNVSVDYIFFDQHDKKSFPEAISKLDEKEYSGILIATLFKEQVIKLSNTLDEKEIPYIYIDSNIPHQHNFSYFGANSEISGAIAARLMISEIGTSGNIIIAHAQYRLKEASTQIENREAGFVQYLKNSGFIGKIYYLDFKPNEKDIGAKKLNEILANSEGSIGCILFNSRIYELAALIKLSKTDSREFKLIGYDPIQENIKAVKNGDVSFIISQRSVQQGYTSIKSLSNYLIFNAPMDKDNYMPIDILMKENIDFYND